MVNLFRLFAFKKADSSGDRALVDNDGHAQVDVQSSALPAGAATSANQQTDALTDTELRASPVPVSASSLPLPSGAATEATLASAKTAAESIDTKTPAQGQAAMAGSVPVAIASDQSAVPISGSVSVTGGITIGTELPVGTNTIGGVTLQDPGGAGGAEVSASGTYGTPLGASSDLGLRAHAINHFIWSPSHPWTGKTADGNYYSMNMNDFGDVLVGIGSIGDSLVARGNGVSGDGCLRVAIASDNTPFGVKAAGDVAHDAADSGNPVKIGAKARTSDPSAVGNGDRVDVQADALGKLVTTPHAVRGQVVSGQQTLTGTSETTILSAGGAGIFVDLAMIYITNSSSSDVTVTLRDATGGGTARPIFVPARGERGFCPPTPLKQGTANNNWTLQLSGGVSSIYATAVGIKRAA